MLGKRLSNITYSGLSSVVVAIEMRAWQCRCLENLARLKNHGIEKLHHVLIKNASSKNWREKPKYLGIAPVRNDDVMS